LEIELHQLELRYAALRRRSARRERAVLASISEIGQQTPVVVLREGGGAVLLDGYKRVRALERLGRDSVLAVEWALPEPEALLLERLMRSAEAESALEQGWLLRELSERFGLAAAELAKRFDKSESWVSRRLALVRELPESIQERVRAGQLQAHAAMKYLVPLARVCREEAERVAEALGARQLSSRNVGALCAAWRTGTEETRALILQSPDVVLRAQEEVRRPAPVLRTDEKLLAELSTIAAISRRVARRLREAPPESWPPVARAEVGRALRSTEADFTTLISTCRKEVIDAGPVAAHRDPRAP
jgi:ParB family transcriptional regulator, chromosome partitioning protein